MRLPESRPDDPITAALLAMARHRLDDRDQARTSLARLRLLLTAPRGANSADAEQLFREAELLIDGPQDRPKN